MKATGIVRRMDDLGRVVIPKELRTENCINVGEAFELFVDIDPETHAPMFIFKKKPLDCIRDVTTAVEAMNHSGDFDCDHAELQKELLEVIKKHERKIKSKYR